MIRIFQPDSSAPRPQPIRWHWATLTGPDAMDFLQRVTTVHTRALQVGEGKPGCFLSAQGKIRAYFTLWNYRENEYGFEFDGGASDHWKEALFTVIDQYTFAEKMTLTDVTGMECRWIFADSEDEGRLLEALGSGSGGSGRLEAGHTVAIDEEIRICHHGSREFGRVWITAWGKPAELSRWVEHKFGNATEVSYETLEDWRISTMSPWVDHELKLEDTIPLEAGLTDAIATHKGCYPGQEVIERIVSHGAPPRRLVLLKGSGSAPATGAKLLNSAEPATEVGYLTSVHADGDRFQALAYVRKIHAKEGFPVRIEGSPATASLSRISSYV